MCEVGPLRLTRETRVSRLACAAAGVPAEYGEMLCMVTETIASGRGSRPNSDVKNVTGVPPISFADFARRTAQACA